MDATQLVIPTECVTRLQSAYLWEEALRGAVPVDLGSAVRSAGLVGGPLQ